MQPLYVYVGLRLIIESHILGSFLPKIFPITSPDFQNFTSIQNLQGKKCHKKIDKLSCLPTLSVVTNIQSESEPAEEEEEVAHANGIYELSFQMDQLSTAGSDMQLRRREQNCQLNEIQY